MTTHHFHPLELSFCGYSGSGKTTLLNKIIRELSAHYKIAYVKHDAHMFQMDKEGKDTATAWNAGAHEVYITDKTHKAHLSNDLEDLTHRKKVFLKSDFVLVEGFKLLPIPKMVLLDSAGDILKKYKSGEIEQVIGFIGMGDRPSDIPDNLPYFNRDDASVIADFVIKYFQQKLEKIPLYGLVLTGGRSTRMQTDKALLKYHGKNQIENCYELLKSHCQKVFVSSQKMQWPASVTKQIPILEDEFLNFGPMGGILTAMKAYPQTAWFVLACDMPFLDPETLMLLLKNRNPFKMSSCFKSESFKGGVEPLCAIYEPKIYSHLLDFVGLGYSCPRKALMKTEIKHIHLQNTLALDNINFPEERQRALVNFAQGGVL